MSTFYCFFIIFCGFAKLEASRILLMPFMQGSHSFWMSEVGRNLINKGHECYAIIGSPYKGAKELMSKSGIHLLEYKLSHNENKEEWLKEQTKQFAHLGIEGKLDVMSMMSFFIDVNDLLLQDGIELLKNNSKLLQDIEELNFDIVVLDGILFTMFNYIIPYKLKIPYVTITTGWVPQITGIPSPPSFVPHQMFKHSDQMSFTERLSQLLYNMFGFVFQQVKSMSGDFLVQEMLPNEPGLTLFDLQRRSDLFIHDLAPPVDYPRPSLPHVIILPGLTIKPAQKLADQQLRNFVDSARDGFIILSLGSYVSDIPEEMFIKLMDLVRNIPQKVIWKYKQVDVENPPTNLKMLSWLPQNDLLGHPNCKLFITNCGNNGQYEALYHGIPMLGFPFFGDQGYNCHRQQTIGYGLCMDVANFTSNDLIENTKELLSNPKYTKKAKLASDILKDDPNLPVEKATYWIEHVMKFGSEHLKSSAIHMPWYQYWMVDVIMTLLIIIMIALFVVMFTCKCMFRCLRRVVRKVKTD